MKKGVIIGGKYKIVEEIGRGGMGQVFKAYQLSLERPVAIKVLNPSLAHQEPDSIKRFHREAKLISSLGQHPHILDIYDFGVEQQHGLRYIVMPYVAPGKTLKDAMKEPLDLMQGIKKLNPIAQALDYAHSMNVIHRDVKPTNILMEVTETTRSFRFILSDFGLGKTLVDSTKISRTGNGSPGGNTF